MIEIKCYGELKNGCFYPRNPQVYLQAIKDAGNVSHCLMTLQGSNKRTLDQNAYMHAMCECIRVALATYGWVDFTSKNVYDWIEKRYCQSTSINEKTGETRQYCKELKNLDRQEFSDVQEKARLHYMEKLDIYIELPHEFYGITAEAYDLWRLGKIHFGEAKRMSK